MAKDLDKLAAEQCEIYEELRAYRSTRFDVNWQIISQYFLPQESDINVTKTEGQVSGWTQNIYDTTAVECAEDLKTGQFTWLTPQNQPWFEYEPPEKIEDNAQIGEIDDEATQFCGRASDIIRKQFAKSNYYTIADMAFLGVGVFGTDCVIFDEGETSLFNFRHCKPGTYVIEDGDDGIVDTLRREVPMTYRQAKQFFNKPGDVLPEELTKEAGKEKARKFKFLHCIFPRADSERLPGAKDGKNKPFASVYISLDYKKTVRVSGYDENPILCQRFAKWGTDAPYGYGPAYLALPLARQLNYVQQYMDALAELHADPRVLVPSNLAGDVDLRAGGATVYDENNENAIPREWMATGEYKLGLELQEQKREAMRRMFFTDVFKLLNSEPLISKEMTAFEISQRLAEKLGGFGPTACRREVEFIQPMLYRAFAISYRAGILKQAPDAMMKKLGGGKTALQTPEIIITTRVSDAQRALKNRGTEETVQFMVPLLEAKPELLDNIDTDRMVKEYAHNTGLPPDVIRSDKDVLKIRQARAELQAQQRQAQLTEQLAAAGKDLGSAPDWVQRQAQSSMGAA